MSHPKFSVIIPVYSELDPIQGGASEQRHYRAEQVQRAIKSIVAQQYPDWELILVDDGCVDGITPALLDRIAETDERIRVIHQENQNRAIARNNGMDAAKGDWICWLDSDDEYSTHYLRELNQAIKDFPEYKIFNFGSIIHFPDHNTQIRSVYAPAIEGKGHEYFRSGHIGCGSFIFSRELWANNPEKYRIPDEVNAYQFAATSRFDMKFTPDHVDWQFIENPGEAFTDGVYRHGLSLGNPWGDDFLQFFLLTRDNHSKPLDVLIYIQYPRSHEGPYEHFGATYEYDV